MECVDHICCKYITLSSSKSLLAPQMGSYEMTGIKKDNKPVYEHLQSKAYLFSVSKTYWLLGDDYRSVVGSAYGTGTEICPTVSQGWNVYEDKKWKKLDMIIKCGTEWTAWSRCDKSCGGGVQIRGRFDDKNDEIRDTKDCK
jgi:hypothetical protein